MNFNFLRNKSNRIKIVSCGVVSTIILSTGCSTIKNTNESSNNVLPSTFTSNSETSDYKDVVIVETSMSSQPDNVTYDFHFSESDIIAFENYLKQQCNGLSLVQYVEAFGFTNELNVMLTDFVNENFVDNPDNYYDMVPFSEVKYFRSYISIKDVDLYHQYSDNYDTFCNIFLKEDSLVTGVFNNRLVLSYLVEYNIPFGSKIPIENLKYFYGDDVYVDADDFTDYILHNKQMGNFDSSYTYTKKDLLYLLIWYNNCISTLCFSEGIPTRSFFYGDPEDAEKTEKAIEAFNAHLIQYFGDSAWQIGKVPTVDNFEKNFKSKLVDTSNLVTPAEKESDAEVKGNSKVRYGDSIDEYTMSYLPGYEYYTEEPEEYGRSR